MKKTISVLLILLFAIQILFIGSFALEEKGANSSSADGEGELPAFFTLVGTPDLPPICNQGEVGCCASTAITYMQFTNAVSKYIREYEPEKTFEPSTGEMKYVFSPKWTYSLSGAGTAWVYNILVQQGCPTFDKSSFVLHPYDQHYMYHMAERTSKVDPSAIKWDIDANQMEQALNYRLSSYEQIWINNEYEVDGKIQITNTEKGQTLLTKIKQSLIDGNVVVTGGFSSAWAYVNVLAKKGNLAADRSEHALVYSRGSKSGGHQVCIVGYDDDIVCRADGVELKGAFLVANSWGESWQNGGYVWLMYDALNEMSEYEELNFEDRVITMDQFCFVDWRTDVVSGLPELYVEADVTAANRESVTLELVRKDVQTEAVNTESLYMYTYRNYHPTYDLLKQGDYLNFNGEVNGGASKVTFTHAYNSLLNVEEGKSISDYRYGINVKRVSGDVLLHSVRLKNAKGEVIAEVKMPDEGKKITGTESVYFDTDLLKLTVPEAEQNSGYHMEGYSAYYPKGAEVTLEYILDEGYTDEKMTVATDKGTALSRNAEGKFVVTMEEDTVLSITGVEKIPEPTPTPSPVPTVIVSDPSEAKTEKPPVRTGLIISVVVVVCVAVVAAVAVICAVLRKKKKS